MKDKIAGALFGMALGDAMGMPAELWGRNRARKFFGGPITELMDGPAENDVAFNYKKGQFTDDTGESLVILDSLANTGFVPDASDIARRMIDWAVKENAWENNILGPTSKLALCNIQKGEDSTAITAKALSNGSAMRIPPIGCLFAPMEPGTPVDPEALVDYVYEVSKATHTSDVTIAGAAMIAMGVASAMVHADFDDVLADILAVEDLGYRKGAETFSPRLAERTRLGVQLAKDTYEDDDQFTQRVYDIIGTGVGIIESVPAAVAVATYAQDPNRACLLCANMGGDTDTIGAMATAICGAFTGLGKFKPEYIETLRQANDIDFDDYVRILQEGRVKISEDLGCRRSND